MIYTCDLSHGSLQSTEFYIPCMSPRNHAGCTAILSRHSRSLLAQFGLTPKSRRGLVAGVALGALGQIA